MRSEIHSKNSVDKPGGGQNRIVPCAYIASLRYNPGLAKEVKVLGDALRKRGWRVRYLLAEGYSDWFLSHAEGEDAHFVTRSPSGKNIVRECLGDYPRIRPALTKLFRECPPDFLCSYNRHPLEPVMARIARLSYPKGLRALFLHEPFVPRKRSYGIPRAVTIAMIERLVSWTLRYTNAIVLPSQHAERLFLAHYRSYAGEVHVVPLLLPDRPARQPLPREYISFVGNINAARGLEDLGKLIAADSRRNGTLRFRVSTRSVVDRWLASLPADAQSRVEIIHEPGLTDDQIADTVARSIALFLPHKEAAQSGNIPVAFREGTPVIARNIPGLAQHVRHKENGFLFPEHPTGEDLCGAADFVNENFPSLSAAAHSDFLSIFSEDTWEEHYGWLRERTASVGPVTD